MALRLWGIFAKWEDDQYAVRLLRIVSSSSQNDEEDSVKMITREKWDMFLSIPLSALEEHGLPNRTLEVLELRFSAVYIRDLQPLSVEDLMCARQIGEESIRNLQVSLRKLLSAVERGECSEWTSNDSKRSRGE